MRTLLLVLVSAFSNVAMALHPELFTDHVYSRQARTEPLPSDLNFQAEKIRVLDRGWFGTLFPGGACDGLLVAQDLPGRLALSVSDADHFNVSWNGAGSRYLHKALVNYFPVYYYAGRAIHPHFLAHVPGWVTFHIEIHRSGDRKTLKLSLVRGRPGVDVITLLPILVAEGI